MSDLDDGQPGEVAFQIGPDAGLQVGVQVGRELVQHQHPRVHQQRPGQAETLQLPARELPPVTARPGRQVMRHGPHLVGQLGDRQGMPQVLVGGIGGTQPQVLGDGGIQYLPALRHQDDGAAQGVEGVFAHGDPVDQDVAAGQLVVAEQQLRGRRLARPAGTDEHRPPARGRGHRNPRKGKVSGHGARVAVVDVAPLDARRRVQAQLPRAVRDRLGGVAQLPEPPRRAQRMIEVSDGVLHAPRPLEQPQ